MAELKTQPNDGDVDAFLASVENDRRRRDAMAMKEVMCRLSGTEARMWGSSIVGFGEYHYTNASGKRASWMRTGFSPRKQALTLYIMDGFDAYETLLGRLGPHSTGRACLYIKDLEEIDMGALEALIASSLTHVAERDEGEPTS
jgi:hypothetical protein